MTSETPQPKTVVLVAYDFSSVLVGGSIRAVTFAEGLGRHGWRVVVCTSSPEHEWPTGAGEMVHIPSPDRSWGGGIRVRAGHDASELGGNPLWMRWLAKLTRHLPLERQMVWIPRLVSIGSEALGARQVHAVLSTAPPYATIRAGDRLARRLGVPHIVDLRDDWVDQARIQRRSGLYRLLQDRSIKPVLARAAAITVTSTSMERRLSALGLRPHLVLNGYVERSFEGVPMEATPVAMDGPLRIAHVGWLGALGSIGPLVGALGRLSEASGGDPEVRLLQVGLFEPTERPFLEAGPASAHVEIRPQVSHDEATRIMQEADVLLVVVSKDLPGAVPGKLYEALRSRRPILLLAGEGSATELARSVGVRFIADPDDEDAIRSTLVSMLEEKRRGTLQAASDPAAVVRLERSVGVGRMVNMLENVVSS